MEQIYTIPVNEAFEQSASDAACGCPFCRLFNRLEENELELILGASMMEPDVRIQTNREGFCRIHYDRMLTRNNRLGMALTMESHLAELKEELRDARLFSAPGKRPVKRVDSLEKSCYVCRRIEFNFAHMIETAVLLWEKDETFRQKLCAQPYFCLPHYRRLLVCAEERLEKKPFAEFEKTVASVVNTYIEKLNGDISWFCKKFDYRYENEPWYDSKDAVERTVYFLKGDLHRSLEKKK